MIISRQYGLKSINVDTDTKICLGWTQMWNNSLKENPDFCLPYHVWSPRGGAWIDDAWCSCLNTSSKYRLVASANLLRVEITTEIKYEK